MTKEFEAQDPDHQQHEYQYRQFWRSVFDVDGARWLWVKQCVCGAERTSIESEPLPRDSGEREKAERVFQAVVYAYEGRDFPEDLRLHGMVQRALKYRAKHYRAKTDW